jgi:uncharacterized membrane protein YbhN (UPF0104 family)
MGGVCRKHLLGAARAGRPDNGKNGMTKSRTGVLALKLLVTASILWWIMHTYGWKSIVETVSHTNITWLAAGCALFITSIFVGAVQWAIILKNRRVAVRFTAVVRLYFISTFLNNFVLGLVTGDIYRIASIHMSAGEGKRGFAATFLDRLAGLIVLSAFAIAGGTFILIKNVNLNKQFAAALSALALFTALFCVILALVGSTRLQALSRRVLAAFSWVPGLGRLQQVFENAFMDLHTPSDRAMFFSVAALSSIVQGMRIGVHILCACALGIFSPSQTFYFFVIVPVIALMMTVPLPLGVKEAGASTLFSVAGFVYQEALVMEFLATLVGIAGALPGAVVFLRGRKKA